MHYQVVGGAWDKYYLSMDSSYCLKLYASSSEAVWQQSGQGLFSLYSHGYLPNSNDGAYIYVTAESSVAAQVTPVSTWDDGSAKHVVLAGRASMSANVARSFALKIGTPAAGTNLGEADLLAAAPSASVSYGSYGRVDLSGLLGTGALVLLEQAGPHYAAFQYIGAFPNDASVRAVFYVQLWSDRQYRIRVAVENATSPGTSSAKSGTAVVSIAGTERFNAAVSMPWATRWDVVATSGSDPAIVPAHDTAYLRATRLVPNYGWTNVDSGTVSALQTIYTPLARLGWTQNMGDTGFQYSIGLLPNWDAVYCCNAAAQAYRAVIAHGRAFGCYSIFYRNASTRRMPKPSDHPNAYNTYDSGGSEAFSGSGTNANRWEFAHCPNAGYLPWLLTAERYFLEALQANAWAFWMSGSTSEAAGTARQWSSRGVICDLASTNELQRLQIVCTDREGSSTTRVDYVPSRGVERIELLKTPPGFERWTKVSPLTLKSKARGLFGQ